MLFFRAVKDGRETAASLESMDLEYLLKYNEFLDIRDYIEEDLQAQIERQSKRK